MYDSAQGQGHLRSSKVKGHYAKRFPIHDFLYVFHVNKIASDLSLYQIASDEQLMRCWPIHDSAQGQGHRTSKVIMLQETTHSYLQLYIAIIAYRMT